MQYLKEEIKERIIEAAQLEFLDKGYQDASMRSIAVKAGISTGSIYVYFKNKEDLFRTIVEPVYDRLMKYLDTIKKSSGLSPIGEINTIKDKILDVFEENSTKLLILMDKSNASPYENIKKNLIEFTNSILVDILLVQLNERNINVKNPYIMHILSVLLIEGVYEILKTEKDGKKISNLLDSLISIIFTDIEERL